MTPNRRIANIVLAHFNVPAAERAAHYKADCHWFESGHELKAGAARTYRAILGSLTYEERQAAEARL